MSGLITTDEGNAGPAVWPVYVAAAVLVVSIEVSCRRRACLCGGALLCAEPRLCWLCYV